MSTYTYTVSTDFDIENIITNINNSTIITSELFNISLSTTTLNITFLTALSVPEENELIYFVDNNSTLINQISSSGTQSTFTVKLATTIGASLTIDYTVGTILDGVTLNKNDTILIKNQTNPIENGVYLIGITGTPERTILTNNTNAGGQLIAVNQGLSNAQTVWICTSSFGQDVVGLTGLYFSRYGTTAGNFYSDNINTGGITGTGLNITGNATISGGITATNLYVTGQTIITGGITGITGRATYSLFGGQLVATSTTYTNVGFFPWKHDLYSTTKHYTDGKVILNTTISDRNLLCQVLEGITLTVLGGPTTISNSGTTEINITNPTADSFIVISIKKNSTGGTSPVINGVNIEYDMI